MQHGGKQEAGLRSGTHNLPGIASMITVLKPRFHQNIDYLWRQIESEFLSGLKVFGFKTSSFIRAVEVVDFELFRSKNESLLVYSAGSACNGGIYEESHVYRHLKKEVKVIRISL